MSDQTIALLIGAATTLALPVIGRLLDWLLPRGWHARWVHDHSVRDRDHDEDDEVEDSDDHH